MKLISSRLCRSIYVFFFSNKYRFYFDFFSRLRKMIGIIIVLIVLIIILLSLISYILFKNYRATRRPWNLLEGVANFKKGNPQDINPKLPLNGQSHLLPYISQNEFPEKKIELDERFIFGAYGAATKAFAHGILSYEEKTTVTVKKIELTTLDEVRRDHKLNTRIES